MARIDLSEQAIALETEIRAANEILPHVQHLKKNESGEHLTEYADPKKIKENRATDIASVSTIYIAQDTADV